MPNQLLGWLRTGLPGRPRQETRGRGGSTRHKVAAPPAGGGDGGSQHLAGGGGSGSHGSPSDLGPADGSAHGTTTAKAGIPATLGVAALLGNARQWGFLLKALTVHSANLAAQLASRPLQPLQERLQQQLAGMAAVQEACQQLQVESLAELQDLMNSVLLSEHVYKIVDHSTEVSVGLMNDVKALFPPQLVTLRHVQWAQEHVRHRFLLGESPDALYVCFMGTKLARDMATNANLFQEEVVLDAAMLSSGASANIEQGGGSGGGGSGSGRTLAAHRGFVTRARSVPIHSLYQEARARGKRLVLCGHSLGGAVASLCAIELLQRLPPNMHHTVSCFGFATPALGNEALAATVVECGWDKRIRNYLAPDDPIPHLLSFRRNPGTTTAAPAAATEKAAAAAVGSGASSEDGSGAAAAGGTAAKAAKALAPHVPAASLGASALADLPAAGNNIQAAPSFAARAAGSRLQRIASHVEGSSGGGRQGLPGLPAALASSSSSDSGGGVLARSASAPALLAERAAAAAPPAAPQPRSHHGNWHPHLAAANSSVADLATAPTAEEWGDATSAPTVEEGGPQAAGTEGSSSGSSRRHHQHWLGQRLAKAAAPPLRAAAQRAGSAALAAAAVPPVRAVVERAGSAARLVALPLSAAASVPMRAAPQYLPIGRQLYLAPACVCAQEPPQGIWDQVELHEAAAAATAAPARNPWAASFWRLPAVPASAAAAAASSSQEGGGSLDDDDNVDVAAAASLRGLADPSTAAAAAAAAGSDGEEAASGGSGAGTMVTGGGGSGSGAAGARRRRRGVFEPHRMATFRKRMLTICQGAIEGHLLLRSLPMLPNLPRPGDVASSELIAPPMFPLRAVATVDAAAAAVVAAGSGALQHAAPKRSSGSGGGGHGKVGGGVAHPAADGGATTGASTAAGHGPRRVGLWQRLLQRAGQQRQEPPVELLIRVEGKGLSNVTQAWIEGIPPAAGADSSSGGSRSQPASSDDASSKPAGGRAGGSGPSSAKQQSMAEVTILERPATPSPMAPLRDRGQLPVVSQLSAFVSWLAVSLGWVALLRQLQPPGRSDYLVARVRLPAGAVESAQRAAQNSLLTSVTDGPLLPGLNLGPRLSLRLQSDFAVHSLPLDIRVAADMPMKHHKHGWQWPWRRDAPQHVPTGRRLQQQQHTSKQQGAEQQRVHKWWEWPGSGSAAAGH